MHSIQKIIISLALASVACAQAASQIPDGQLQQIPDGQVQAVTAAPPAASQIGDGQIQVPTSVPVVSQITDGQVQVPTAVASQISDGQIQVPTVASTGSPAPSSNGTFTSPAPTAAFTGAANLLSFNKEVVVAAMGAAAGFAML
ncbi:hypothetical protein MMC21_000863 [Puttea exsequens]|nr:hypothetical protein [Puttea exsequens]